MARARQWAGLVGSALLALTLGSVSPHVSAAQAADWLFIGRHILPMTGSEAPTADKDGDRALAVVGREIAWLGAAADAAAWQGPKTQTIELGDRALLPGFIDAHGHVTFQAATIDMANVAAPPVGPVKDMRSLIRTLADYIEAKRPEPGSWIIGNGYDDSLLREQRHPTRRDLDKVTTEHPIALIHVSGHLMTANSAALKLAGITSDSEDPHGGHIRRFAGSEEPSGVLEETATYALRPFAFSAQKDPLKSLGDALALYASHGITTVQDGATAPPGIELLQSAAAAGLIEQDVIFFPVVNDVVPIPGKWFLGRYRDRVKAGGVKLVLDGSPQGKTAFLSQPYHVPPEGKDADYRGYPIHTPEKVRRMVGHYLDAGVPMLAHANGDAAADLLIDAVAASLRGLGEERDVPARDHRTVMIHAQTVRDDQLDDIAQLGIIPSFFSAHTFFWGDWHRDSVLGKERALRISPMASSTARGIPYTVHNDAPIVPPDMIRLLWASTNRETRSGKTLGAKERASTWEALLAITRHAARQAFEESRKGTLEAGKLADLVVLSRNPLTMRASALRKLQVEGTWSHGRQIYAATPK
ncbi:MAG: amidohydrolase [Pseudomonadota bacterium]